MPFCVASELWSSLVCHSSGFARGVSVKICLKSTQFYCTPGFSIGFTFPYIFIGCDNSQPACYSSVTHLWRLTIREQYYVCDRRIGMFLVLYLDFGTVKDKDQSGHPWIFLNWSVLTVLPSFLVIRNILGDV